MYAEWPRTSVISGGQVYAEVVLPVYHVGPTTVKGCKETDYIGLQSRICVHRPTFPHT